jgi:hypothetical protein
MRKAKAQKRRSACGSQRNQESFCGLKFKSREENRLLAQREFALICSDLLSVQCYCLLAELTCLLPIFMGAPQGGISTSKVQGVLLQQINMST